MKIILHAHPKKVPHSEFKEVEYTLVKKSFRPVEGDYKTLRRTVTTNFSKMKFRRDKLNKVIKEGHINIYSNFIWAKFWRKIILLKDFCEQLKKEPDLPGYNISNLNRATQVLNSVDDSVEYYKKFRPLFLHVSWDYGYGISSFIEFKKTLKKEEEFKIKKIPRNYISYYRP